MKFFDFHAVLIQKSYLGYMSRQYVHSFAKRAKVLKEYKEKEKEVEEMMKAHVKEMGELMEVDLIYRRRKKWTNKKFTSKIWLENYTTWSQPRLSLVSTILLTPRSQQPLARMLKHTSRLFSRRNTQQVRFGRADYRQQSSSFVISIQTQATTVKRMTGMRV